MRVCMSVRVRACVCVCVGGGGGRCVYMKVVCMFVSVSLCLEMG